MEGVVLGEYRIRSTLGSGGMGTVYRAHDPQLDRPVAIKVLRRAAGATSTRLPRLHREALARIPRTRVIQGARGSNACSKWLG